MKNQKKTITKKWLAKNYQVKKNKDICRELGITNSTLVRYLDFFDIKKKGRGNRRIGKKIKLIK